MFISTLLPSWKDEKQCLREVDADDLCTSHPQCMSAPLPVHFNIFQLFNIYYLYRFVLLISYSWPEEMYRRVLKRVHSLFFKGAISTTAVLQTRTRCTAFGHHSLLGLLRHQVQENQTSLTTPSQWPFKGHKDVVSHQERRHSASGRYRSPYLSVFVLIPAETPLSPSACLGSSHEHPSLLYLQLFYKSPPRPVINHQPASSFTYLQYFFQLLGARGLPVRI